MATQFAVLLPAESLAQAGVAMEADDVWTLSLRTMLLFHVATRVREDPALGAAERAQRAIQAWLEIDDLERRLARHTCEFDSSFGFQAQEMLFGCVARDPSPPSVRCGSVGLTGGDRCRLRMITSYDFQLFIPQISTCVPMPFAFARGSNNDA